MYQAIEFAFEKFVEYGIIILEFIGVVIILGSAARALISMCQKKTNIRLDLAQGIALALEFKLGSEVLHTVIVREPKELIVVGAIVVLRAAMTFLIHWEIKIEEAHLL